MVAVKVCDMSDPLSQLFQLRHTDQHMYVRTVQTKVDIEHTSQQS